MKPTPEQMATSALLLSNASPDIAIKLHSPIAQALADEREKALEDARLAVYELVPGIISDESLAKSEVLSEAMDAIEALKGGS